MNKRLNWLQHWLVVKLLSNTFQVIVRIEIPAGEVIAPGSIKMVEGFGMPVRTHKGNLIIHFNVKFPENNFADEESLKKLASLLPKPKEVKIPADADVDDCTMVPAKLETK